MNKHLKDLQESINKIDWAIEVKVLGYRPCGHCMKAEYLQWKNKKNEHII